MIQGMGVQWALTFLGLLALCFAPLPFLFYFKGKSIRAKSKFAPAPDIEQDKKRDEESGPEEEKTGNEENGNGEEAKKQA